MISKVISLLIILLFISSCGTKESIDPKWAPYLCNYISDSNRLYEKSIEDFYKYDGSDASTVKLMIIDIFTKHHDYLNKFIDGLNSGNIYIKGKDYKKNVEVAISVLIYYRITVDKYIEKANNINVIDQESFYDNLVNIKIDLQNDINNKQINLMQLFNRNENMVNNLTHSPQCKFL